MKPTGIALVVCDDIYQEMTGKVALVGLFKQISSYKFPVVHNRMCIYASCTGCRKDTKFRLDLVHGESDEPIMVAQGPPPEGSTPLTIVDFQFVFTNITFKEPGVHYVRLWGNDHILLQRPFEVRRIIPKSESGS